MAKNYTFPHWEVNVIDNSIYIPTVVESLPLFRPMYFMRAQKGPVGIPTWVHDSTSAVKVFGAGTFDDTTKYYSREAIFASSTFRRQGAFIVRMANADAAAGSLVLQLRVKKTQVVQYQRDEYGQFILDAEGNRVPETDESGVTVKEPGYELKWTTRPLKLDGDNPESMRTLKPTTVGSGDISYTTYPILVVKAQDVGEFSNYMGVKFFVADEIDTALAAAVKSLPYSIGFVEKTYGQDTVSPIKTNTGGNFADFVAKPDQTDVRFSRPVSYSAIMSDKYSSLALDTYLYSDYIKEIGEKILEVENDPSLVDPYQVNLAEPYTIDGVPYSHVVLSEEDDSIYLDDSRVLYLQKGADGDISDEAIEALTRQYLNDDIYPELQDQARYPFTHIVDTGVSINTKKSFINYLGKHDAFKCILATQDCTTGRYNTLDEDLSIGSALNATALLHPESILKGTECCRCEIYMQAGKLAGSNYQGIIPTTLDVVMKKSYCMSTESMGALPVGLPYSSVDLFKNWNWVPYSPEVKQRAWDLGLNYFQYYDQVSVHWPAMRTVYSYDTSVLTSAFFTDAVVLTKHAARYAWATYAGTEYRFADLAARATDTLKRKLGKILNSSTYSYEVEFTQSEEEAKIGYIAHATIRLTAPAQNRVWVVDIECNREGYNAGEE